LERFGFIIHPMNAKDVARVAPKYAFARYLPAWPVEQYLKRHRPVVVSHITGVRSKTGAEAEGWFIGCPLTPDQLLRYPHDFVYGHIARAAQLAADQGAKIVGLGAFTSVVDDGGITVPRIQAVRSGSRFAGGDWIGIRPSDSAIVRGVSVFPLALGLIGLAALVGATLAAWLTEGRARA